MAVVIKLAEAVIQSIIIVSVPMTVFAAGESGIGKLRNGDSDIGKIPVVKILVLAFVVHRPGKQIVFPGKLQ